MSKFTKSGKRAILEAALLVSIAAMAFGFILYMPLAVQKCELLESEQDNPNCEASPPALAPSKDALKNAHKALEQIRQNEIMGAGQ